MYPNELNLELKVGAQVMFVKNDLNIEKRYFNGKLGEITSIDDELITVKCPNEKEEIAVSKSTWDNIKYVLNDSKTLQENTIGTFTQFPIKTAWAITIHKSQGLTFERAIIDAASSFAHGQVFVALSR
jgi:ATP-dependent exoDNAse (exonuclease V) alpha subunit